MDLASYSESGLEIIDIELDSDLISNVYNTPQNIMLGRKTASIFYYVDHFLASERARLVHRACSNRGGEC